MYKVLLISTLIFLLTSASSLGAPPQLTQKFVLIEPEKSDVIRVGKTQLGVLPARRIVFGSAGVAGARSIQMVIEAKSDDPISHARPGVVFNYSMRAYGLISGEIVFKLRDGTDTANLNWGKTGLPGSFTGESTYIVNVPNVSEFVRVMTMLQASTEVVWVEPTVNYVPFAIE